MKALVRSVLRRFHLMDLASHSSRCLRGLSRRLRGVDRCILQRYFDAHDERRLHLGCGQNLPEGWLNTDYYPLLAGVMHVDATQTFPFADDSFDFAYTEHMIEHIPFGGAQVMLRECYRVLKKGGCLRVTTPDLAFLIDLYGAGHSELQERYMSWAGEKLPDDAPGHVINNFVRNWGHLFIYDERTLGDALRDAGFAEVERCELNLSSSPVLQGLENEGRMPEGFLRLESITLEARK